MVAEDDLEGWYFTMDEDTTAKAAPFAQKPKSDAEWAEMLAALAAPFPPEWIDFRPNKGEALAYIDARVVMDRLDAVVGPHNWTFVPVALITTPKEVLVVHGKLTVHGVTKEDYGEASNFHATKGAASDALKRCAVHFGVGRYLYRVDGFPVSGNTLSEAQKRQLRARLPRPQTAPGGEAPLYASTSAAPGGEGAPAQTQQTQANRAAPNAGSTPPPSAPAPSAPAPSAPKVAPLSLPSWDHAKWAAVARGAAKDASAWDALVAKHPTLDQLGAHLATLKVVNQDAEARWRAPEPAGAR